MAKKGEKIEKRDGILWSKLRVWQLEDYQKVILLDSDLIVLKNVDELFQYPELAGSAMMDKKEKILFFRSSSYGLGKRSKYERNKIDEIMLEGWSGLNSGVTVVEPSNTTFTKMINELSIIPNRPCCPSQEFIYNYFETRNRFFRLPFVYNARPVGNTANIISILQHAKIYHFVGAKPWKRRDKFSSMNSLWWRYKDDLENKRLL
jgi:alpha-N-acetylglucosamine transferase